jgi:serine/threonine protein kinase
MLHFDRFGPYHVHEQLGAGGMATVHRASVEVGSGVRRDVALKRMHPELEGDQRIIEHMIREAQLASTLQHPNIVRIFDSGCIDGTHYIAMELVYGVPLLAVMRGAHKTKRLLPVPVVVALLGELCDALDYASNGTDVYGEPLRLVHRDLSPANLLVTDDGHLKLIDFGLAKATTGKRFRTSSGLVKGKLGYMSPEALDSSPLDGRADVFSAGIIAWELLCTRQLFKGKTDDEVLSAARTRRIPSPSRYHDECPPALDEIVMRALARDVDDRWQSASSMREALEKLRRSLRGGSSARDVAAWLGKVPGRKRMSVTYADEADEIRVSTSDIVSAEHGALEAMVIDPDGTEKEIALPDFERTDRVVLDPDDEPSKEIVIKSRARTVPGLGPNKPRRKGRH